MSDALAYNVAVPFKLPFAIKISVLSFLSGRFTLALTKHFSNQLRPLGLKKSCDTSVTC